MIPTKHATTSAAAGSDPLGRLKSLLARARGQQAVVIGASERFDAGSAERELLEDAGERLGRSVVRPLERARRRASAGKRKSQRTSNPASKRTPARRAAVELRPDQDVAGWLGGEDLWQLTRDATALGPAAGLPSELKEAIAALQDLALRFEPASDGGGGSPRLAELERMQARLGCVIQSQTDGPYLVTNAATLLNWLGEELPARPQMALCRCGQSAMKPFCDGTHADVGFSGRKDPKRVPDKRDRYVGEQVTILDNRGICQHSGFCSDRLPTAFRVEKEPFVAPSGGRMDELIRAVRDCPSGALSYATDGHEAREHVDYHGTREPAIEVSKDGPYRITGAIALLDGGGEPERRNAGASSEHYALCRCGHSQNKPFCSGMHWYVEFKDPPLGSDHEPTIFEWAGGLPALRRMTRLFYEKHVPQDPLLAPLFANMSDDHPERVAKWLGEVFCGPRDYSGQYGGYVRMISQHLGKGITEEKRARWVELLLKSAREAGLPDDPEFRSAFASYIEWGSHVAVENSAPGAHPPPQMPMPHWDWNTAAGPPGRRISALAAPDEEQDATAVLPGAGEAVSFERHIRALFRRRDRQSMEFAFDLWSCDDVQANAQEILARLQNGSMPCDGAWPAEKIDAFRRWVEGGMPA